MRKLILLSILIFFGSIAYSYENTYAVIIGVADYKNFSTYSGDLQWTTNDARLFYNFLRSKQGGSVPADNIVYLTDAKASKANILSKAKAIFSKATSEDRVIFYFSGHGDKDCFLPYDADGSGSNVLYFSEVKSIFRCAKCNTKLLFADACFSGSMKDNLLKNEQMKTNLEKSIKATSNINIAVMMSCQSSETSIELPELRQGVFTYYLIQGLGGMANRDDNKYITIQELFYYVYRKTQAKAAQHHHTQTPELFGKFDLRLIVGEL